MNPIRKFLGQTAIYGIGHMVGRLLNFLLVPIYVSQFTRAEYGQVTDLYAMVVFLIVVLTYGMETTFFRYIHKDEEPNRVYSTGLISLISTSVLFLAMVVLFSGSIAGALRYAGNPEYILWFAWILALDAIAALPFAKLRAENRAKRFAVIKFLNIGINVALNLFFILFLPLYLEKNPDSTLSAIYDPNMGVGYIFLSNLAASAITLLILLPEILPSSPGENRIGFTPKFDRKLWRQMMWYAFPIMLAGLAGAVNEVADRQFLKYLLPSDESFTQLGVYGACYKLSIFITLFIQAFRYGAEPFFFAQAGRNREVYARVMDIFVMFVVVIFVALNLFLDPISQVFIPNPAYHEGLHIVPILLMANLFLGLYVNLSIWYKLSDQTRYGAMISGVGAVITIGLNLLLIPKMGYTGAAWATLVTYGTMMVISYVLGQKHYPIPYHWQKNAGFILFGIAIVLIMRNIHLGIAINAIAFAIFAAVLIYFERHSIKRFIGK